MILTVMILAAQAAPAATATPTPGDKPVVVANRNQVICVTDSNTGSRLGSQRVCHTRAEWEETRRDFANTLDRKSVEGGPR